jgi:hypothetical protein
MTQLGGETLARAVTQQLVDEIVQVALEDPARSTDAH